MFCALVFTSDSSRYARTDGHRGRHLTISGRNNMHQASTYDDSVPFELSAELTEPIKLLCIDDDPEVAHALNRSFRNKGISTITAYHGTQGYWLACTEKPDVIVIDLRMPRGNGEDVIQSIRTNAVTRHIPIIVLSGSHTFGIKQRVLDLGADCFLEKPASTTEILRTIHGLLH